VVSPLRHKRLVVDAPASTANLGAGFDALALAVDLVDRVELKVRRKPGLKLAIDGEGAGVLPADAHNRFVVALETGLRWALGEVPAGVGWDIRMHNAIPLARGLGSSAAVTVAGLVAANMLAGETLDDHRLLEVAIGLEGHADNAAAAIFGGFTVVVSGDGSPIVARFDPPPRLRCVVFIPTLELATTRMRQVLPAQVPYRDAVFNVGRAALAVAAFASGRPDYLRLATEDRLHQGYRTTVYPALPSLLDAAREAGALGAALSGSGSTVVAFTDSTEMSDAVAAAFVRAAAAAGLEGTVQTLHPRTAGAVVVEAD
jgi:homoserine kinase